MTTTMARFTLPVVVTLKDSRYCTGCHLRNGNYCQMFLTQRTRFQRVLRFDRVARQYKRLSQCKTVASEVTR